MKKYGSNYKGAAKLNKQARMPSDTWPSTPHGPKNPAGRQGTAEACPKGWNANVHGHMSGGASGGAGGTTMGNYNNMGDGAYRMHRKSGMRRKYGSKGKKGMGY